MAYSVAHDRLYLGYDGGAISYIDLAGDLHARTSARPRSARRGRRRCRGRTSCSPRTTAEGYGQTHYIFDASGALRGQREMSDFSRASRTIP